MKRRDAVKSIILFSLGTGIIYSCADKYKVIRDLGLKYFTPKDSELDIIEKLSQMMVPINTIPELANHTTLPFLFTMLDDIYEKKERDDFLNGYQNFDLTIESMAGKKFSKMNQEEQSELVARLNSKTAAVDEVTQSFFNIVKAESIHYLKSSEYYQRKINYYEMAPGRFDGDILISELKNANEI